MEGSPIVRSRKSRMAEERESVGGGSDASVKRVCRRGSSSSVGSTTEAPLILILEMLGYLIAIDLNQHQRQDGCVPVPVLLRLDLPTSMYPVGMHHVKTKQGGVVKHYLLGGITDYGYSNKIYELKADLLLSIIARGDDVSHGVVLNEISTTLTGAKCPTSFDLGDTTYLLHRFQPYHTSGFGPDFPFERLDASSDQSWLVEKDPPFYQTWPTQDMDGRDVPMEIDGENLKKVKFESYFAVGDKLLIFCNDQSLQWFTPGIGDNNGEGAWDSSTDRYEHVSDSFRFCGAHVPKTGLWLSDFNFQGDDSSGVLLSLYKSYEEAYNPTRKSRNIIYTVCAYAMCKTTFKVNFYQRLDEVFSDILPHPALNPLDSSTLTYRFLDLGRGDGEDTRRICALLTGRGLIDRIIYLFVSIFDLQMIPQQINFTKYCPSAFLNVSHPVRKRTFSFNEHQNWYEDFNSNILDAFVL